MSTHRFAKCRKLGFDLLEESSLLSVSGASEAGVDEPQRVVAALETTAASVATTAEQSVEILGYDGTLDATSDSTETGTRYRIFDYWGGAWVDAEKDTQAGDDLLCWAGAASNVLAWTGWGQVGGMTNTDQIFQYFQDHFTDKGSLPQFGWDWWFDGTNPAQGSGWIGWAQVDVAGGGFYSSYSPYDYIHTRGQGITAEYYSMMDVDQYCRAGYGVALGIFGSIGHAITCWGFNYDSSLSPSDPNYYKGVWVTDSDDNKYTSNGATAPDNLHYYAVAWDSVDGHYDFNSYSYGAYIGEVDGLERSPGATSPTTPPVPNPPVQSDFDSDGISDIVWHNQWTGDVGVWLVKNDRAIDWMGLGTAPASIYKIVGIGDFNADGISDVLWQNQDTGNVGAWLVNGSGAISWRGLGTAPISIYKVVGVGDFNADGISDVLWHNQDTGNVGAWLVNSSGAISWKGFGTMVPADWKPACDDTSSSPLLASGNAASESPISSSVQSARHGLLGDAVARAASAALDVSAAAASYQNRFASELRSDFGLSDSYLSRTSFDHGLENAGGSASDLGQEVARSTDDLRAGAVDPNVLDRIDLAKWIDEGLQRREDADVFDRLAADHVGSLGDVGFQADWNADVDSCLAG